MVGGGGPLPRVGPPLLTPSSLWQLMSLRPDATNAFQALLDIWLSAGGERGAGAGLSHRGALRNPPGRAPRPLSPSPCPQASPGAPRCRTSARPSLAWAPTWAPCAATTCCPPSCAPRSRGEPPIGTSTLGWHRPPVPTPRAAPRLPDPSCCPGQPSLDAAGTLALVTQLGDICKVGASPVLHHTFVTALPLIGQHQHPLGLPPPCPCLFGGVGAPPVTPRLPLQFLELCVAAQPRRYPDRARRQLLALLCFLGLDRALRRQPLPGLQQLLLCLLEGIADWRGQVPGTGEGGSAAPCPAGNPAPPLSTPLPSPRSSPRSACPCASSLSTTTTCWPSWGCCPTAPAGAGRSPAVPVPGTGTPAGAGGAPRARCHAARAGPRLALIPLFQPVAQAQSGQEPAAGAAAPRHEQPEGTGVTPALRGHRGSGSGAGGTRPVPTLFPSLPRELRRRLSLCVMARLLGEPPGTALPLGAEVGEAPRVPLGGGGVPECP